MLSLKFCYCIFFLCSGIGFCFATNTLTFNSSIRDDAGETLISSSGKFELGFFSPEGNSGDRRYVGIWYYDLTPRTVVWVANRNHPLFDHSGVFGIADDGNLRLTDGSSDSILLTDLNGSNSSKRAMKLMDAGNLVLSEETPDSGEEKVLWQSFDQPTDTFLPGMTINESLKLISWNAKDDPAVGAFTFRKDAEQQGQYVIVKEGLTPSGFLGKLSTNIDIFPLLSYLLSNSCDRGDQGSCLLENNSKCIDVQTANCNNTRLVMSMDGQLQFFRLESFANNKKFWSFIWSGPERCGACGNFSSCNNGNIWFCKCLPGFKPNLQDNWNSEQYSHGCTRKSPICSKNSRINNFLKLGMIEVANPDLESVLHNGSDCKELCLDNCKCQAYSYTGAETYRRDLNFTSNVICSIWEKALNNILEDQIVGGRDIYLRVMHSDIEPTKRSCETCGTTIIPYPLSTGTSCGDPMYFSFNCETNTLTGRLYFNAGGAKYQVTSINPELQKFSIGVKNAENCRPKEMMERFLQLDHSSPFYVGSGCNFKQRNFISDSLYDELFEIDIGWNPPLEPLCNTSQDCSDWPNSSCLVAKDRKRRCLCYASKASNASFQWDPSIVNCTSAEYPSQNKRSQDLQKPLYLVIAGVIAATLISCFYFVYHKRKRRLANRKDLEKRERESSRGNLALCLHDSEKRIKDFINSGQFGEDDKKDIDVPFLDLESIIAATDNFSGANKLGQGGFGPVYKGKYPGGQEIAIKRLSSGSGQGLEEFKNEVVLIAKLQHRNLVRLLGYCVEGQEKMLIYEYMPNKSLDSFIFDRTQCLLLTWEMRFDIILGIARGMLYLHQDSRLRIIHRDLKTSNVLLDEEMNPKISDFGLARIFGSRQTVASTTRVVGTYGYMSPEYALDGFFSFKSDVFSFGVVVLEIISGKRNTGFYQSEQALSLLGYTWRLWEEERALDLMDQTLRETCNTSEFLRCVNVGLLCVQEDPSDRPTMSNVVFMLGNEVATLPKPKQPAFVLRRSLSGTTSSSKEEANSELMTTLEEGR
ncbi:hypothetical protein SLE2022_051170 [Rubroshorea leprosula]